MATYKEVAKSIVKEAISSAIYIDEKAIEPFSEPVRPGTEEANRSVELYNSFKNESISLSIFKYIVDSYKACKDYIFKNRDLILLDWELEGQGQGGEKALEILSDIICDQPHIHFCAIYTAEKDKDCVLKNVISYFSSTIKTEYDDYRLELESDQDVIDSISKFNHLILHREPDNIQDAFRYDAKIIETIHSVINAENKLCSLIKCAIAFDDSVFKSAKPLPCPKSFNAQTYTLIIENTIIQIINKQETSPDKLVDLLSDNISNYKWGIMQLLGLEMQNISRKKSSFVSPDVLQVSKNTLAYHKKNHGEEFQSFIKNILIEQNAASLINENLSLVETIEEKDKCDSNTELIAMNVFYNTIHLNCNKNISFGDIFKCEEDYFICITALCDCIRPNEKINNPFFFAKGWYIKPSTALKYAETGFVSFLDEKNAIIWDSNNGDDGKVSYIKPICFTIPNNVIVDRKIKAFQLDKTGNRIGFDFQYITTIKQNYAQRIANHAFAYPIRVGVDFVKIGN